MITLYSNNNYNEKELETLKRAVEKLQEYIKCPRKNLITRTCKNCEYRHLCSDLKFFMKHLEKINSNI